MRRPCLRSTIPLSCGDGESQPDRVAGRNVARPFYMRTVRCWPWTNRRAGCWRRKVGPKRAAICNAPSCSRCRRAIIGRAARNLRYVRFVHRLDAETSGALLLAKTPGALSVLSRLFGDAAATKTYLAVVRGHPPQSQWTCRLKIAPCRTPPAECRPGELPASKLRRDYGFEARAAKRAGGAVP